MKRLVILIALALIFAFIAAPPVSAKPKKVLKCELYIELNWGWFKGVSPYTWTGRVSGDINGEIHITLANPPRFTGKTEHFYEIWEIVTDDGHVIRGYDEGVWHFSNFKWVANGKVTYVTGEWSYLVGYNMHYSGTTTELPVPPGTPVSGTSKLQIS